MEFNISDLLDDFQDDSVVLQPQKVASVSRIKELTMKKIHKEDQKPRRGLRTLGRTMLVAAIVVALATTVLAASGFQFTDWVNGVRGGSYDKDVNAGSESNNWTISGWVLNLAAKDAASGGLTLRCKEYGWERQGTLTTDGEFWLEQWVENEYVRIEPKMEAVSGTEARISITADELAFWDINWEESYGLLPSGYYRIGKTFTLTLDSGETEELVGYAKFRIFTDEMEPYLERCTQAVQALQDMESYHVSYTSYPSVWGDQNDTFYSMEEWKNGGDYLLDQKYLRETENGTEQISRSGSMLRDGAGYALEWEGDSAQTPVSFWERADYVDEGDFRIWVLLQSWSSSRVGEVTAEGNEIILLSTTGIADYPYEEVRFTFDEQGDVASIEYLYLEEKDCAEEEKLLHSILVVHDTSVDGIGQTIGSQDVTRPGSFSWKEEKDAYPDARRDGFLNTAPQIIETWEDVVRIAQADSIMSSDTGMVYQNKYYNIVAVFFDDEAGMWKVEYSASQHDYFQAVYLDENGITQMVVNSEK